MHWQGQIRRFRKARGLTQAALAEHLGVEQATVSRWECGTHEPELGIQRRLRDMIYGKGPGSDCFILNSIRFSPFAVKLVTSDGTNLAASTNAALCHGVMTQQLASAHYRPFYTEELEKNWDRAVEMGFFDGDLICVQVYNKWKPLDGGSEKACMSYWTPTRLSGGEIVMFGEFKMIEEDELALIPPEARFAAHPMDTSIR